MIGEYHIVYEQALRDWAAYSPDAPGCMATDHPREEVERTMREALAPWAEEGQY
ncbi:MAG: hypothetical protein ACRDIE_23050 [Chloroflexota bacterium]